MAFVYFNPNPAKKLVGDCVVRALCKALNMDWVTAYSEIVLQGLSMYDMPSSNNVWGSYLKSKGFRVKPLPDNCPNCYTVEQFCIDHPIGSYIVATGTHTIAIDSGDFFDTWDSASETIIFYFEKEN
jgi:hypothetical protein